MWWGDPSGGPEVGGAGVPRVETPGRVPLGGPRVAGRGSLVEAPGRGDPGRAPCGGLGEENAPCGEPGARWRPAQRHRWSSPGV